MIHLNIGSNLNSNFGNRFDNISIAIKLLIESKFNIKKISNTGINRISVGTITHSAKSFDTSLLFS